MQRNSFDVIRIPTSGPGDVSGLMALVDSGGLKPSSILAVLGKTEGNGGVNDFTREYAVAALCNALAPRLALTPRAVESRIAFVMSGGTEGVLSPHMTVFARGRSPEAAHDSAGEARLSVGIAHTRDFLPEEIGRNAQIGETASAVATAMREARIDAVSDVHFVQIKCPLLTSERGHCERVRVDGLFAWRFRARRRQGARRDRGGCRRSPGAEKLGPLLLRRLLFGRH
jgi:cyanuric acid amidohydrolase